MPYVFVSTQIRLENGETTVGDELSDPVLMKAIGALPVIQLGNNFKEYRTPDVPRVVLNKLELHGYQVVCMSGIGQTCVWTLHKPLADDKDVTKLDDSSQICNDLVTKET
ncbi:GTP cyclohydrolase 1 feedback regulatory protein-like [Lineus longissimus]|uniref:GTP cyclohydrolase 1 feedback regulatory protein-like n=1 Tax=Lineus longissimus TaxID=88925 RepID=UPI002B4D54DC